MEEPAEVVLRLVRDISGDRNVGPQTLLWHDLHIGGDDVFELLDDIHRKFGTSFEGFDIDGFFPDEHEHFGAFWAAKLGFGSKRKPLSVQHLTDVVARGQWFDPPTS